jgi:exodeoxyribonuclease-3
VRIATWNVNSLRVRMPHLQDWLAANAVDAIALQETKLADAEFPCGDFTTLGFNQAYCGQRTYNGVAILSREPLTDVVLGIPGFEDEQRRVVAGTLGDVRIIDVYVPNGQTVGSDKFEYKLRWLAALERYLIASLAKYPRLVVLGDYNIAPEDRDVHDPQAWQAPCT